MSTFPSERKGSRFFDTDSTKSILDSSPRTALATTLAISTSKPSGLLVEGFNRPNRGWSYFVPTTIRPRSWMRFSVPGLGLMVGDGLPDGEALPEGDAPGEAVDGSVVARDVVVAALLSLPHAVTRAITLRASTNLFIPVPFLGPSLLSVTQDLVQE